MSLYKFLNDLYQFCKAAPVNSSCLHLALIDGTRSGPASPRQILRFLPFRDQWPDQGLPEVPWLLPEPHRPHLNGRRVNKCSLHPPLGPSFGPNFGPEAPQQPIWTQILRRYGVRVEDGIPRQRHTALAHRLLGRISDAFKVAQRECQRRRGIALCPLFTISIPVRIRRPSGQRTVELHQWVCIEGPRCCRCGYGRVQAEMRHRTLACDITNIYHPKKRSCIRITSSSG